MMRRTPSSRRRALRVRRAAVQVETLEGRLLLAGPAATTLAATAIGNTSATLNGSINPEGTSTVASFEYSTDPTLGAVVTTLAGTAGHGGSADGTGAAAEFDFPAGVAVDAAGEVYVADQGNSTIRKVSIPTVLVQSGVTGTTAVPESTTLTGLQPDTTYDYQAVATSAAGSGDGATLSFTTLPATATTTAVKASTNPATVGQPVTFTAAVYPSSGSAAPTGTVQFEVNGSPLGAPVTLVDGAATSAPDALLTTGDHVVTALYVNTDGSFAGSTGTLPTGLTVAGPQTTPAPSLDFVIGSFGNVYTHALDASGNPTSGYEQIAYGQVNDLAATRFGGTANFEAFVIGTDNEVYADTIVGGKSSGYFATAYGSIASIAAGTDASGDPLLFAIGTDNQLYEQTFNASGQATSPSYTKAAYGDFKSAILTHDASGNPLLYAVGQDGQVYGLKMTATGAPSGGLFKMADGGVKQLAVGASAGGDPEIFVIGLDNNVYELKADATGSPAGGYVGQIIGPVESITVGADSSGDPLLFAIGSDGQVYGHRFDATGAPTGSFYGTAAGSVSSISAGFGAGGDPEVFAVLSSDSQVYAQPFDPTGKSTGAFALTTDGAVKQVVVV